MIFFGLYKLLKKKLLIYYSLEQIINVDDDIKTDWKLIAPKDEAKAIIHGGSSFLNTKIKCKYNFVKSCVD